MFNRSVIGVTGGNLEYEDNTVNSYNYQQQPNNPPSFQRQAITPRQG